MKGKYPREYFQNPSINKPIEDIWDDIDAYTGEYFEDETRLHSKIDFFVTLPPLNYEGKITKGIFFTQGLEYILKLYPQLKEIFFCGAYTMWSSYSWCDKADFYLNCYKNEMREQYHKNKYQNKKDITFIPLQDADFTNEYRMAPTYNTPKTKDIICISTPYPVKNLPMLAQAIVAYKNKYNKILKTTFALGSKDIIKNEDGSIDYSNAKESSKKELKKVEEILGDLKKEMDFIPYVKYDDLPRYISESRCCVLASLIEGKNRSINEAMSCNVPIVVFKQHNQWARGEHPIFFGNSGELAEEFTPESLADAIHKIIENPQNYKPRYNYLKYCGRKNFVNNLIKHIPYYRENIPEYKDGELLDNLWINLAMQANYQISYHDYVYGKKPAISRVVGTEKIDTLVKFFYSRFKIK